MSRKYMFILWGSAIGILLITAGVIFNHYRNAQSREPVKVYKSVSPVERAPKTQESIATPQTARQPVSPAADGLSDTQGDVREPQTTDTEIVEDQFQPETEDFIDASEPLPIPETQQPPQEDPRSTLLKEVFPELDRLATDSQALAEDVKSATLEDFAAFEARGKAIENEIQDYCQRIAEAFPGTVNFITFQGEEWAYDVDFQAIQNSLEGPVSPELENYFQHVSLREMLGVPEIPAEQLHQLQ